MTPETWAKKAVENLGPVAAHDITQSAGRPQIGVDASVPNPFFKFYECARNWIKNRFAWDENGRWYRKDIAK
jgi:hypothetical protein